MIKPGEIVLTEQHTIEKCFFLLDCQHSLKSLFCVTGCFHTNVYIVRSFFLRYRKEILWKKSAKELWSRAFAFILWDIVFLNCTAPELSYRIQPSEIKRNAVHRKKLRKRIMERSHVWNHILHLFTAGKAWWMFGVFCLFCMLALPSVFCWIGTHTPYCLWKNGNYATYFQISLPVSLVKKDFKKINRRKNLELSDS